LIRFREPVNRTTLEFQKQIYEFYGFNKDKHKAFLQLPIYKDKFSEKDFKKYPRFDNEEERLNKLKEIDASK
jgi:hypothetical protein